MTDKEKFKNLIKHVVLMFNYGSTVYGTLTENSDKDIVCIVDDSFDLSDSYNGIWEYHDGDCDYQFLNEKNWIEKIKEHHIIWLECYSLPQEHILVGNPSDYMKYFNLDLWKLRQVCSKISSNAWAKCHKKLVVEKDYDLYRAQKSLFHSLRILLFATQIAKYGKITDYSEANHYWDEIYSMKTFEWPEIKEKYQPIFNSLKSDMVKCCPKSEEYIQSKLETKIAEQHHKNIQHMNYVPMWRNLSDK